MNGYGFVVQDFGPLNQERLIPYHRVDVRLSRIFRLRKGDLLVYVDVCKAMNRENAQSAAYGVWVLEDGTLVTDQTIHPQFEILPTVGARWTF